MRQGIIIFADAPKKGGAEALKATVDAALQTADVTPFVAYSDSNASQSLRDLLGGPPPRFFPQATRPTLGERMAQAFAFLFVQGYEHVMLATGPLKAPAPARFETLFAALASDPVVIETDGDGYLVTLRRADFPQVAAIFEEVAWDKPGAKASAERLLEENGAKA
jgi:hypothetical protein